MVVPCFVSAVRLRNPMDPAGAGLLPFELIARIIKALLGFIGILAVLNFIIAGITFIWSRGNEKYVTQARDNMLWTVIGIVAIFASYAVLSFVIETLINP